jgi:hypothetical protein
MKHKVVKVPRARDMLWEVIQQKHGYVPPAVCRVLKMALILMFREKAVRRVSGTPHKITMGERILIKRLARTDLTMVEIANRVGIKNQGRISEVLTGQR